MSSDPDTPQRPTTNQPKPLTDDQAEGALAHVLVVMLHLDVDTHPVGLAFEKHGINTI